MPSSYAPAESQHCFGSSFLCLIPEWDELRKGQTKGFALKMVFKNSAFPKGSISTILKSCSFPFKMTNQLLPNSTGGSSSRARAPPCISPCTAAVRLLHGRSLPARSSLLRPFPGASQSTRDTWTWWGGCSCEHDRAGWGLRGPLAPLGALLTPHPHAPGWGGSGLPPRSCSSSVAPW